MSRPRSVGHVILQIVSPSWFEFVFSILVAVGLAGFLVFGAISRDAELSQYVSITTENIKQAGEGSKDIVGTINNSPLIGDATIFVLWALIGLMIYAVVNSLWQKAKSEVGFIERLQFFKNDRASMLESTFQGLALRLAATVGLIGFLATFRYSILPHILALIYSAFSMPIYQATLAIGIGIFAIILCLHVTVVLVRLSLLRTRVFFTKYSAVD